MGILRLDKAKSKKRIITQPFVLSCKKDAEVFFSVFNKDTLSLSVRFGYETISIKNTKLSAIARLLMF